jgi:hypothetical protein
MRRFVPTYKQWKGWTIPSKASYLGFVLTVVGAICDVIYQSITPANHQKTWIRVTDISDIRFSSLASATGTYKSIFATGEVLGLVSDPSMTVFVLIDVARRQDEMVERVEEKLWGISEAIVAADGSWQAQVCKHPHLRSAERPFFEFWEIMAVATHEPEDLMEHVVDQQCSIRENDLASLHRIACSGTRVTMRPPEDGVGAYLHDVEPRPRNPC